MLQMFTVVVWGNICSADKIKVQNGVTGTISYLLFWPDFNGAYIIGYSLIVINIYMGNIIIKS
jgi:hypothetical protein